MAVMPQRLLITTLLLISPLGALAADNGIYLGASIGQANTKLDEGFTDGFDADDTGYKFILGIRPLDWLGFEASYVDLGQADDRVDGVRLRSDVDGIAAYAIGFLAVGPVDVFAKGGAITWDASVTSPDLNLSADDDGTDLAFGVGAQFRVWSLSLRAEYEIFDIGSADDVNLLSVGVTWTFL
jgi:hypothetical protein